MILMINHVAHLAKREAFDKGSLHSQVVEPGITVELGRRHGSRTEEGIAYYFDAAQLTPVQAQEWTRTRCITTIQFVTAPLPSNEPIQEEDGTWTLPSVDVLRIGTANASKGGRVTIDDTFLTEVERDTNRYISELKPPQKFGHEPPPGSMFTADGAPALGWVDKVSRVGDKLVASIRKVPNALYLAMKKGLWRRQSAEIMANWTAPDGTKCPHVLKAIALLGSELPAIQTLDDLVAFSEDTTQTVCLIDGAVIQTDNQGKNPDKGSTMTPEEIKALVQQLIAEALAPKEPTTKGDGTSMTAEETKQMTSLREQIYDLRLTAALSAGKITPAEVTRQKPLLLTLTMEQATLALDAIDSREADATKIKSLASTTEPVKDPNAGLAGKVKIMAFAASFQEEKKGTYADGLIEACKRFPEDNKLMRIEQGLFVSEE
jgi:hypothetical protein